MGVRRKMAGPNEVNNFENTVRLTDKSGET